SSNTSHLVELLERKFKTYFISSEKEIIDKNEIHHFDYPNHKHLTSHNYFPDKDLPTGQAGKVTIILTSGASCPDAVVERVMNKIVSFFPQAKTTEEVLTQL